MAYIQKILILLTMSFVVLAAWHSGNDFSQMSMNNIVKFSKEDKEAVAVADSIRTVIRQTRDRTILYLNGIDSGDNFYRLRYQMYPVKFVDYWSWGSPNAGGQVWNTPEFSTLSSVRRILEANHVNYIVAIHQPNLLKNLHIYTSGLCVFRVDSSLLTRDVPLGRVLDRMEVPPV